MKVLVRAIGDPETGFGHVRRAWTLAAELRRRGSQVAFSTNYDTLADLLKTDHFDCVSEGTFHPERLDPSPSAFVVDDPRFSPDKLAELSQIAPVCCIDDTGDRFFPVDLVVNGSAGARKIKYRGADKTRFLLGPDYMLLRREFEDNPPVKSDGEVRRVIVMSGGVDAGKFAELAMAVTAETLPFAHIDLVVGPMADRPKVPAGLESRIKPHFMPGNLRALMINSDISISAAGQTAYELAATRTPVLAVCVAPNQWNNLRNLEDAGCLVNLGFPDDPLFSKRLSEKLIELSADSKSRKKIGENGRRLVDGLGARRVAEELFSCCRQRAGTGAAA